MYIRGRQREIGEQGSRHQVTSCNERAKIDVEESQENEDDDDDDDDDETRKKRGRNSSKGTRERDEETFGHASRTQQWQSQVCYCEWSFEG